MFKRFFKRNQIVEEVVEKQPLLYIPENVKAIRAIHRTGSPDDELEVVTVLKNPVGKNNGFALIQKENGEIFQTGGILRDYDERTWKFLQTMSNEEQYDWLKIIIHPPINNYNPKEICYAKK